jgi:tRNA/tmRNA/rRNA uracil-C5-methylase (TrmA/RlmC/RlmD family)
VNGHGGDGDGDDGLDTDATAQCSQTTRQTKGGGGGCSGAQQRVANNNHKKRARRCCSKNEDPSLQYLQDPTKAPLVRAARQFFASALHNSKDTTFRSANNNNSSFAVHVRDVVGWRTVAKLAVRNKACHTAKKGGGSCHNNNQTTRRRQQLTIGLFEPGTHNVIPMVPDDDDIDIDDIVVVVGCAHHAAITAAIRVVQRVARQLGIVPYDEVVTAGTGQLRHVALAVQRHSQRVQCTLVWNNTNDGISQQTFGRPDQTVDRLVQALIEESSSSSSSSSNRRPNTATAAEATTSSSSSSVTVAWHSIWWHGNATGKHSNAIFDHDGNWKLLYSYDDDDDKDNCQSNHGKDGRSGQQASHKTVLPPPPLACRGITEYLECAGCPVRFPLYFPPQVFRQANLTAFAAIVQSIRGYLQERYRMGDNDPLTKPIQCLELYGGVGTIGLHLADLCSSLVSSDENPHNVTCFEASAQVLLQQLAQLPNRQRQPLPTIRYQSASAAQMVARGEFHENVNVIVVDPPRKGLEDSVSAALVQASRRSPRVVTGANTTSSSSPHRYQTLVYVSCGFDAFQRDFDILTRMHDGSNSAHHPWKLHRAEGHVLFPGSNAIETLAFFTREHPQCPSR